MTTKNPKELFLMLLSNLRESTERTTKFFQEIIPLVKDSEVKEALEARIFVQGKIGETLDQCFKVIGEKPVKVGDRLTEVFVDEFRREINEIQTPEGKLLFVLVKCSHIIHFRIGEYVALIAAADVTGHYAAGLLLETCLADQLAFVERNRRLIRERIRARVAAA